MTNSEKKQELWEKLKSNYSHLENYCTIELRGIEDETIYFHPTFVIDSETTITTQSDVGNNKSVYAARFNTTNEINNFTIEIYEGIISSVIVGYNTNKESVLLALSTLFKVREHSIKIDNYTVEYVNNIILGSSIKEITDAYINELKTTSSVVEFMQKNSKK